MGTVDRIEQSTMLDQQNLGVDFTRDLATLIDTYEKKGFAVCNLCFVLEQILLHIRMGVVEEALESLELQMVVGK